MQQVENGIWSGSAARGLGAALLAVACALSLALFASPTAAHADASDLKAGSALTAQAAASKSCALYTSGNKLVPCTSAGKQTSANWDGLFDYSKIKTLFIASNVKTVKKSASYTESLSSGSKYSGTENLGDLPLSKIVFLKNSKGVNACTSIAASAFQLSSAKTISNFEKTKVATIGKDAFESSALQSISLPSTLKTIGTEAFGSCDKLKTVSGLAKTKITSVPQGAFMMCKKLTGAISLPSTCKSIAAYAFHSGSFAKVTVGKNVKSIGDFAFASNKKLSTVSLPASVKSLGEGVFYNNALKSVSMRSTTVVKAKAETSSVMGVFNSTPIAKASAKAYIKVPKSLVSKYKASSAWKTYKSKIRSL